MFRSLLGALLLVLTAPAFAVDPEASEAFNAAIEEARTAMMRNPNDALAAAERAAQAVASQTPSDERAEMLARAEWLQAEALTRLGRSADAGPIVDRALNRLGSAPAPTKLYADLMVARGRVAMATSRYDAAFISFTEAYDVFREIEDTRSEAIVLQSLASIYTAAKQYDRALDYLESAVERYSDPSLDLAAYNNRANARRELGDYSAALEEYENALAAAQTMGSAMLEGRILNNIAALHAQFEAFDAADQALNRAESLMEGAGSGEWRRFVDGVRAEVDLGRGNLESARTLLGNTFDGIPLDQTPPAFTEFHGAAVQVFIGLGEWELALNHLTAFKRLEDEARDVAASANSALLGAQFEFAEQDLQIQQLRTERLEQSLALASEQERVRILTLCGLLALILCVLIYAFMRFRTEAARKRALAQALYHDADTQLPSRKALEESVTQMSATGQETYVLAIEVDRHEQLRSALGFATFATLGRAMAERLLETQEPGHVGVIAPGVFGVLLDADVVDDAGEDALEVLAEELRDCLLAPVHVGEIEVDVTVTIGAARLVPGDESTAAFKHAVIAVKQARDERATFARFDPAKFGDPARNLTLMSRMSAATASGEVVLHYQPKLNLRTGKFESAEALMRWTDPERGYIPPDAYIPFAEETGYIRELTDWSLERALTDQLALSKAGFPMAIAVNISSALLIDADFAAKAAQIAAQSRHGLIFEVTETAIMADVERAIRTLELWNRGGVTVSIDDYGTGQSSLAYLKRLPARELKLDRAFITEVAKSQRDRLLVKSTVDLAHNLGLSMTAEGVEDEETLRVLKVMGCDSVQGFGLCKPKRLIDLVGFLQNQDVAAPDLDSNPDAREASS